MVTACPTVHQVCDDLGDVERQFNYPCVRRRAAYRNVINSDMEGTVSSSESAQTPTDAGTDEQFLAELNDVAAQCGQLWGMLEVSLPKPAPELIESIRLQISNGFDALRTGDATPVELSDRSLRECARVKLQYGMHIARWVGNLPPLRRMEYVFNGVDAVCGWIDVASHPLVEALLGPRLRNFMLDWATNSALCLLNTAESELLESGVDAKALKQAVSRLATIPSDADAQKAILCAVRLLTAYYLTKKGADASDDANERPTKKTLPAGTTADHLDNRNTRPNPRVHGALAETAPRVGGATSTPPESDPSTPPRPPGRNDKRLTWDKDGTGRWGSKPFEGPPQAKLLLWLLAFKEGKAHWEAIAEELCPGKSCKAGDEATRKANMREARVVVQTAFSRLRKATERCWGWTSEQLPDCDPKGYYLLNLLDTSMDRPPAYGEQAKYRNASRPNRKLTKSRHRKIIPSSDLVENAGDSGQ